MDGNFKIILSFPIWCSFLIDIYIFCTMLLIFQFHDNHHWRKAEYSSSSFPPLTSIEQILCICFTTGDPASISLCTRWHTTSDSQLLAEQTPAGVWFLQYVPTNFVSLPPICLSMGPNVLTGSHCRQIQCSSSFWCTFCWRASCFSWRR